MPYEKARFWHPMMLSAAMKQRTEIDRIVAGLDSAFSEVPFTR